MRRGLTVALLALVAAVPAAASSSSRASTSVGVGEREWRVSLYRTRVPTGVLRLNVHNFGEDGHDLALRNRDGRVLAALPELSPGDSDTLRVRLRKPGRFVAFCSLEGHEANGMRARLTVVKRRRR
jgi:hypothetical protein